MWPCTLLPAPFRLLGSFRINLEFLTTDVNPLVDMPLEPRPPYPDLEFKVYSQPPQPLFTHPSEGTETPWEANSLLRYRLLGRQWGPRGSSVVFAVDSESPGVYTSFSSSLSSNVLGNYG